MRHSNQDASSAKDGEIYDFPLGKRKTSHINTETKTRNNGDDLLTDLQKSTMRILAQGHGIEGASKILNISPISVQAVIKTCRQKLRAKDNFHLMVRAYQDKIFK